MTAVANFRLLRLGRELRSLTQSALAERAGVSQGQISSFETGLRQPDSTELTRLARAVELPVEFFLAPDAPAAAPLFRKRAIRSPRKARELQARLNVALMAARRILDAGIDIASPFSFPLPGELAGDPEQAARELRRAWRLPAGRIDHVTEVIEGAGGVVLYVDFGSDDASAAFIASLGDERLWFFVNTRETAPDRIRFSLAHELGHALLHRFMPSHDEARYEPEAFAFAQHLLLPPEDFNQRVSPNLTLKSARELKRHYWVSIQAITKTAADRDLITGARYTSLYKQVSARNWRRVEPDPPPLEGAGLWPDVLQVHRERHHFDDAELASIAHIGQRDLNSLFPLNFRPMLEVVPTSDRPDPTPEPRAVSARERHRGKLRAL